MHKSAFGTARLLVAPRGSPMTSPICLTLIRVMYKPPTLPKGLQKEGKKRAEDGKDDDSPQKRAKLDCEGERLDVVVDSAISVREAALTSRADSLGRVAGAKPPPESELDRSSKTGSTEGPESSTDADELERATFSFPERLMELLNQSVEQEALWWLPDGDGFCVLPKLFADRVLNKYFQGTKFESFTRKLNRWGFKRAAGHHIPANTLAYYHSHFQKGKPELLKNMRGGKKRDSSAGDDLSSSPLGTSLQRSMRSSMAPSGGSLLPPGLPGASLNALALAGGTILPGGGLYIPPHLVAASTMSSPLDQELQLQSLLVSQQAELARQQRARLLAAELANEQASAEFMRRALAQSALTSGSSDLSAAMLLATSQASAASSLVGAPAPSAAAYAASANLDPVLLQLLLERQRQQDQNRNMPR